MTFGKTQNKGGEISFSPQEWERLMKRKPVVKQTSSSDGDYELIVKLTRKRRTPGSTYEV